MSLQDLAPSYIRAIAPYQPGKPISELAREMNLEPEDIVKLASNENPLGMSPMARAAIERTLPELARYPDGNGFELKAKIAQRFGVSAGSIVLGNGSNDILELVARAFLTPADSSVYSEYAFAVYPLVVQACGSQGIEVRAVDYGHDLEAMRAAIRPDTKVVWIANPNNPTGTLARPGDLIEFLEQCPPQVLVVLDEAYTEFLPREKRSDSIQWLQRFPNLIVVRTFSKAYGLAGLRVGFGLASPEVADILNRVRQPFNVNLLAQAAACAALDDTVFLADSLRVNNEGMKQLTDAFVRLGLSFIPSCGNFVTFHCGDAAGLNRFMLQRGVIVRPLAGYRMPDSLRVSIGLPEENARFIAVLEEALGD
ncbi:histidinol-phosphate aminotransferase 2 [Chitiniphilus shinanonensis]|uniref:Histidinol-phosphate aminotransferase n=1 Tax=Chitiniphilus shinanonensis TaxID=553088 RepID=A0ABQ6BRS5_9NEIS|nr:histidinol-phosphate transaminase [Chitiniphilus shinanonensis]GLS04318.1 histidinol-phosphate aminotransferase 2 [Chitiniphilus shinanonensis]